MRAVDRPLERSLAVAANEIVGILAVGEKQEARLLAVRQHRQRVLQRAPRGLASGGVAVEAEDDEIGEAEELLRMDGRRRRAQRRNGVLDAVLRQRHDIHVAFDDEDAAGIANRVSREIEAVELFSLREDGCFGGVKVFWLAVRPARGRRNR